MLAEENYPALISLQETKLDSLFHSAELRLPQHIIYRADRSASGGGVLLAVASGASSRRLQISLPAGRTEAIFAVVSGLTPRPLTVGSVYSPDCRDDSLITMLGCALGKIKGPILIGGDFNMPDLILAGKSLTPRSARSRALFDLLEDHGLSIETTAPTRFDKFLDLIISRGVHVKQSAAGDCVSDHRSLCAHIYVSDLPKNLPSTVRCWRKADTVAIKRLLMAKLYPVPQGDPTELWEVFVRAHCSALELVPTVSRLPHGHHHFPLPRSTIQLIRKKRRRLVAWKRFQRVADFEEYKSLRSEVKAAVRSACTSFFDKLSDAPQPDIWKFVRGLRKSKGIPMLLDGTAATYLDRDKADVLNSFFSSVFTREPVTDQIPPIDSLTTDSVPPICVDPAGVLKRCETLKTASSAGPDGVSAIFLKIFSYEIAPFLAALFQASFDSGVLPVDWKSSIVVPIHKSGARSNPGNYRPISLTSIVCKMAEHIIASTLMSFLEVHNLLSPFQHGFRKARSTESQLIYVLHLIHAAKHPVDVVAFDFKKAFDAVPHRRLLAKLSSLGASTQIISWCGAFLSGRSQRTRVGASLSDSTAVLSGVPQGSVLGPLLFLLFVNDIPACVKSNACLYADDTLIFREIATPEDARVLQDDIDHLFAWTKRWLLPFNLAKCKVLRVRVSGCAATRTPPPVYTLALGSHPLEVVEELVYLGLVLTKNLKMKSQTERLTSKARAALGIIIRNLSMCSPQVKLKLYCSMVRPILEYASAAAGPSLITDIARLEMVQRRAVRFITGTLRVRDPPVTKMMHDLGLTSLESRRRALRFKTISNIAAGKLGVPLSDIKILPPGRRASLEFYNRTLSESAPAVRNTIVSSLRPPVLQTGPMTTNFWNSFI